MLQFSLLIRLFNFDFFQRLDPEFVKEQMALILQLQTQLRNEEMALVLMKKIHQNNKEAEEVYQITHISRIVSLKIGLHPSSRVLPKNLSRKIKYFQKINPFWEKKSKFQYNIVFTLHLVVNFCWLYSKPAEKKKFNPLLFLKKISSFFLCVCVKKKKLLARLSGIMDNEKACGSNITHPSSIRGESICQRAVVGHFLFLKCKPTATTANAQCSYKKMIILQTAVVKTTPITNQNVPNSSHRSSSSPAPGKLSNSSVKGNQPQRMQPSPTPTSLKTLIVPDLSQLKPVNYVSPDHAMPPLKRTMKLICNLFQDPKSLPQGLPTSLMNMINKTVANKLGEKMPESLKPVKMMETETPQQKQAAAKLALRKQLEKTLLQVIVIVVISLECLYREIIADFKEEKVLFHIPFVCSTGFVLWNLDSSTEASTTRDAFHSKPNQHRIYLPARIGRVCG